MIGPIVVPIPSVALIANTFAGSDMGAKIQAANDYAESFGAGTAAEIRTLPGQTNATNTFSTQVNLAASKKVILGHGYYPNNIADAGGAGINFLVRDNCSITGDGWGTIVEQPRGMVLVAPYVNAIVSNDAPGPSHWSVADMQIVTPNNPRASTGGETAIGVGNSSRVTLSNLLFNGTYGIDITLGGTSNPYGSPAASNHADGVLVYACFHRYGGVDDAIKMAPVNAKNWQIIGCQYLNGAILDVEQNASTDDVSGWLISGCLWQQGHLLIQGPQVRYGTISGCTFHGETQGTVAISLDGCIGVRVGGSTVIDGYNGGDTIESGGIKINTAIGCVVENTNITNCSIPSVTPNTQNNAPITIIKSLDTEIKNCRVESPLHGWSGIHEDVDCVNTRLENNFFGYGSGSVINLTTTGDIPRYAPVSSQSIGQSLPQSTIYSPLARFAIAPGTFTIETFNGTAMTTQTVSFTGVTNTSFTGCTGGTGQMILGALPDISLLGTNVQEFDTTYATADGYQTLKKVGPQFRARRKVTSSTSLTLTDAVVGVDSSTGAVTLTLPTPSTAAAYGSSWTLRIQDEGNAAATHNITIARAGTEKINGAAANYVISTNSKGVNVYSDGTDWFIS